MGFHEHADSKRLGVVLQLPPDTEAGVHKIRWLAELGVPTIHLSIGAEPPSVEASRVCVLTDPPTASAGHGRCATSPAGAGDAPGDAPVPPVHDPTPG
jgi:hypothetical protein